MGDLASITLGGRRGLLRGTRAADWYELGCALERRDPAGAERAFARAVAGRWDFADAHNNLARVLHDRGELAAAEAHYRLALCADPGTSARSLYWFNLGVVLEDRERAAEAIAAYERCLELAPGTADAHYNLARLLERAGRSTGDDTLVFRAIRHLAQARRAVAAR